MHFTSIEHFEAEQRLVVVPRLTVRHLQYEVNFWDLEMGWLCTDAQVAVLTLFDTLSLF